MKSYNDYVTEHVDELKEIKVDELLENIKEVADYALKDSLSISYLSHLDDKELNAMKSIFKSYSEMEDVIKAYTDHVNDMYQRQLRIEDKLDKILSRLEKVETKLTSSK